MVKDLISDTFIRIKNGYKLQFDSVYIDNSSRKIIHLLDLLYLEGFIRGYNLKKDKIKILLKYSLDGKIAMKKIVLISKPGRKIFISAKNLWLLNSIKGSGCFFLTTSKGFMSLRKALKKSIGGELVCYVL